MLTARLEIRPPVEADRDRFVELFCDESFMIYTGVLDPGGAHRRFDHMLTAADEIPFSKRPVTDRRTGMILGYSGADWFDFDGERRLEFGYRLVSDARGRGYATDAGLAMVEVARTCFSGELLAAIRPVNTASQRVADKLGFSYWKPAVIDGDPFDLHRLQI